MFNIHQLNLTCICQTQRKIPSIPYQQTFGKSEEEELPLNRKMPSTEQAV